MASDHNSEEGNSVNDGPRRETASIGRSSNFRKFRRTLFPNFFIMLELLNSGQNASWRRKYLYWLAVIACILPMLFLGIYLFHPIVWQVVKTIQPTLRKWGVVDLLRLLTAAPRRKSDLAVLLRPASYLFLIGICYPCLIVSLRVARKIVLGDQATLIIHELYYPDEESAADEKPLTSGIRNSNSNVDE